MLNEKPLLIVLGAILSVFGCCLMTQIIAAIAKKGRLEINKIEKRLKEQFGQKLTTELVQDGLLYEDII